MTSACLMRCNSQGGGRNPPTKDLTNARARAGLELFSSIFYYEGITKVTGISWEFCEYLINHFVRHYEPIKKITGKCRWQCVIPLPIPNIVRIRSQLYFRPFSLIIVIKRIKINSFIISFDMFSITFGTQFWARLRTSNNKSQQMTSNNSKLHQMPVDNLWITLRTLWISRRISHL